MLSMCYTVVLNRKIADILLLTILQYTAFSYVVGFSRVLLLLFVGQNIY